MASAAPGKGTAINEKGQEITEGSEGPGEGHEPELPPATDWSKIRGVNYIPSYAASPYQAWKEYKPETVEIELARAKKIGFNSVRIFLSYSAYEEKPSAFMKNYSHFMEAAHTTGLTVMPVLFDSWGVEREQNYSLELETAPVATAKARERKETVLNAYKKFLSRPDAYKIDGKNYERLLKVIAEKLAPTRQIPVTMDPSSVFWMEWTPSPGHSRLGKKDWPRYRDYVKEIIGPYRADSRVAAWDIMNEPDAIRVFGERTDPQEAYDFVGEMIRAAREAAPAQPLTVGTAGGWTGARVFAAKLDLVSLHLHQRPLAEMVADLREARRREKPVVVSAIGGTLFPAIERDADAETQRESLRKTMIQLEREHAGFYLWHLVEGEATTSWCGLIKSDGTPKPAAEWLQNEFARGQ